MAVIGQYRGVNINSGSDADIQKQMAAIDKQLDSKSSSSSSSTKNTTSSTKTSTTKKETKPEKKTDEWYLEAGQVNSDGSWKVKPVLTINEKVYSFNTAEELKSKLNELYSAGSNNLDKNWLNSWNTWLDDISKKQTPSTATSLQAPTANLTPGMTGDSVKQLQDYLVSKGYLTEAQKNTGYGTYGPQTTAAVAKLQSDLGVDNSSGVGYWGPKTIQAVGSGTSTQTGGQQTSSPATEGGLDQDAIDGLKYLTGMDDAQIQQYFQQNPGETAQWAMVGEYMKKQADLNGAQSSANVQAIAEAYTKAANDPLIAQKYKEIADFDKQSFQQGLQAAQQAATIDSDTLKMQFENDRKALAEANAAKGTAYSGFRNKAAQDLGKIEAGIVQSSRAELQKKLNDATAAFEQKYGSDATKAATANFMDPYASSNITLGGLYAPNTGTTTTLAGTKIGGVTGTLAGQKAADITARQSEIVKGLAPPTT